MRARLAAIPVVILGAGVSPWWTCGLYDPARDPTLAPSHAEKPSSPPFEQHRSRGEIALPEQRTPKVLPDIPPVIIPDEAVVHAINRGQPAFLYCFHRAQRDDPSLVSAKINIHLYVDPSGGVMSAHTDITDPKFASCLLSVAKRLHFPPPNALAIANLTFLAS
jgi:hypothetical protein